MYTVLRHCRVCNYESLERVTGFSGHSSDTLTHLACPNCESTNMYCFISTEELPTVNTAKVRAFFDFRSISAELKKLASKFRRQELEDNQAKEVLL